MDGLSEDAEVAVKWMARFVYNREKRVFSLSKRHKGLLRSHLDGSELRPIFDELRSKGFVELVCNGKLRITDKGMSKRMVIRSCENCKAVSYGSGSVSHSQFCSGSRMSKHLVGEFLDRGEY